MPRVRKLIAGAGNTILESNSVLRFLRPDLALSVLDPSVADFKASALRYLDRVDALVMPVGVALGGWEGVSERLVAGKPRFGFEAPEYCPEALAEFVRRKVMGISPTV